MSYANLAFVFSRPQLFRANSKRIYPSCLKSSEWLGFLLSKLQTYFDKYHSSTCSHRLKRHSNSRQPTRRGGRMATYQQRIALKGQEGTIAHFTNLLREIKNETSVNSAETIENAIEFWTSYGSSRPQNGSTFCFYQRSQFYCPSRYMKYNSFVIQSD